MLTLAVSWPVLRFEVLPGATSSIVEAMAEAEGLRLRVGDWSLSLTDFSATAHDVVIEGSGAYRERFLFKAREVEVDANVWQNLRDGLGRWRRHVANSARWVVGARTRPLPPRSLGRAITVRGAELHVERLTTGRYYWQDAVAHTASPGSESAGTEPYFVPEVAIERLEVAYVGHLPAEASAGLEQSLTSSLHIDEATLTLTDFVGPADARDDPTDFSFDGRIADGRVSATGAFNLWAPSFVLDLSLTNLGAATLGMLSPDASLTSAAGTLTGHLVLDRIRECVVNLTFRDVRFRANPRSPIVAPRHDAIERQLRDLVVSEAVQAPCTGNWTDPRFRPLWAVQASTTARALDDAPSAVRAAAQIDRQWF